MCRVTSGTEGKEKEGGEKEGREREREREVIEKCDQAGSNVIQTQHHFVHYKFNSWHHTSITTANINKEKKPLTYTAQQQARASVSTTLTRKTASQNYGSKNYM